jgi:phosphopentomutase
MDSFFQHVVVVDLGALGIGEAPEANRYDSVGADTLKCAAMQLTNFNLPTLAQWGLGNLRDANPVPGVPTVAEPTGFYGRVHVSTADWTATTGWAELWQGDATAVFDRLMHAGIAVNVVSATAIAGMAQPIQQVADDEAALAQATTHQQGLTVIRLVDGLRLAAAQQSEAYASWLMTIDARLGTLSQQLPADTLLIVTATQAIDPETGRLTREYVPLFSFSRKRPTGIALGIRRTLADVAATVEKNFLGVQSQAGHAFLSELGLTTGD